MAADFVFDIEGMLLESSFVFWFDSSPCLANRSFSLSENCIFSAAIENQ